MCAGRETRWKCTAEAAKIGADRGSDGAEGDLGSAVPYASVLYEKSLISSGLIGRTKGGGAVARVVVDVMLKPEILDSQGQTIARKLPQLGFAGITSVRQGKRFEIELDGPADEDALEQVRKIAETLLANPVIETFDMRVE